MATAHKIMTQPEDISPINSLRRELVKSEKDLFNQFKYGDLCYFHYLIEFYMNSASEIDDSLYNFIKNIILDYNNNPNSLNEKTVKFLKYLDSKQFDIWFVENFMFHLMLNYYNLKDKSIGLYKKIINKGFKEWCDRWYILYSRNTVISRVTRNVIQPCQNRFIERLFNPHTKLGYEFGEKKRDELPWGN